MKVPKKIYLYPYSTDGRYEVETKPLEGTVEYTCSDAFIEKACDWLKENYKSYIIVDIDNKYEGIDGLFLEDFKKYMKGE